MYRANAEGKPAQDTRVMQGMLEGSNVNAITEMTRMIDVHRAYQSTQRMLQNEHERQTNMIQKMTRG
jgi:flagellar basal-body rod protein FlgF